MLDTRSASVMTVAEAELTLHMDELMKERIEEVAEELKEQTSSLFQSVSKLVDERWVFFENKKAFYDNEVVGIYPDTEYFECQRTETTSYIDIPKNWLSFDGLQGEAPSNAELRKSFHPQIKSPIKQIQGNLYHGKGLFDNYVGYKNRNYFYIYNVTSDGTSTSSGSNKTVLPIYRLNEENSSVLPNNEVIALFLKNKLVPKGLSDQETKQFEALMNSPFIEIEDKVIVLNEEKLFNSVKQGTIKQFFTQNLDYATLEQAIRDQTEELPNETITNQLLNCEHIRAGRLCRSGFDRRLCHA